jgi:hypothetical protein
MCAQMQVRKFFSPAVIPLIRKADFSEPAEREVDSVHTWDGEGIADIPDTGRKPVAQNDNTRRGRRCGGCRFGGQQSGGGESWPYSSVPGRR